MPTMNPSGEWTGHRITDIIDALRTDLVTYRGLTMLGAHRDAWEVSERIYRRLAVMDPRLKDELVVALIDRQATPLAHKMVHGGRADIAALTAPSTPDGAA